MGVIPKVTVAKAPDQGGAAARLLTVPHRFFFIVGVAQLALISAWWLYVLLARSMPGLPDLSAATPDTTVHALLMLYGFAPFFMFGFLFTAGPRWLAVAPPPPSAWLLPGVVAAGAALALLPLQLVAAGQRAQQIAALVYAVAWAVLLLQFVRLVLRSDQRDKVHATLVAAALTAGAIGLGSFAAFGSLAHAWLSEIGLWLFMIPVFVTVCHRMIPFFTSSALPFVLAFRPWWLLIVLVSAPVLHGGLDIAAAQSWTWLVDLPAGVLLLWVAARWGLVQSLRNRLLAMLHIGFVWYAFGLLLAGGRSVALAMHADSAAFALAPLHALAIGFIASLTMAMVTRVSCGHSGRTLAADALTWRLFQLLQLTAILRLAADMPSAPWLLAIAGLSWAIAVVPWCAKYAPLYWRARSDGRPG